MTLDPDKKYSLNELKEVTKQQQTSIKLNDGKIVSNGMLFQDEKQLDKATHFLKKYYKFIDIITLKFLRK